MRVNHNVPATVTQGALAINNRGLVKNLERLSTGLRVNRASDDAAGLAISEGLRTQIRGSQQAKRNALDGISALNIAEGATNEISAILQRQRELAIQASTATYSSTERAYMDLEFQQLTSEIMRITRATNFNGMKLLDTDNMDPLSGVIINDALPPRFGSDGNSILWIDANDKMGIDSIDVQFKPLLINNFSNNAEIGWLESTTAGEPGARGAVTAHANGTTTGSWDPDTGTGTGTMAWLGEVLTASHAQATITLLDQAIRTVNDMRADIGSYVNRLESVVNNLDISITNQAAAESQIRDADFALQSSEFSRSQILTQSATAMLAQANQVPQTVLSLIR